MKIILNEFVSNLGSPGDEVEVKPGYARNYLLPKRLAVVSSESNRKVYETTRKHRARKLVRIMADATEQKRFLEEELKELKFTRLAGQSGKLFGSVTAIDIETILKEKGFSIDRKQIALIQPIKTLGKFNVDLMLFQGVKATLSLIVENEDKEKTDKSDDSKPDKETDIENGPIEINDDTQTNSDDMTETRVEPKQE